MKPTKTRTSSRNGKSGNPSSPGSRARTNKKGKASGSAGANGLTAKNANGAMRVPRPSVLTNRSTDALKRLGVAADDLATAPEVSSILKPFGGTKAIVSGLRGSQDAVLAEFLKRYDSISERDRESLAIEAIILAAGVDSNQFLGAAMQALRSRSGMLTMSTLLAGHPKTTAARVEAAKKLSGTRDRDSMDIALGLLPPLSRAGTTFIGKQIFGSGAGVMNEQRTLNGNAGNGDVVDGDIDDDNVPQAPEGIDVDRLFPAANLTQEKLLPIRQRMLSEGTSEPEREARVAELRRQRRLAMGIPLDDPEN